MSTPSTIEKTIDSWLTSFEYYVALVLRAIGFFWFIALECLEEIALALKAEFDQAISSKDQVCLTAENAPLLDFVSSYICAILLPGYTSTTSSSVMPGSLYPPSPMSPNLAEFKTPRQTPASLAVPIFKCAETQSSVSLKRDKLGLIAEKHVNIRPIILGGSASSIFKRQLLEIETSWIRAALGIFTNTSTPTLSFVGRKISESEHIVLAYKFCAPLVVSEILSEQDIRLALQIESAAEDAASASLVSTEPSASRSPAKRAPSTPVLNAAALPFKPLHSSNSSFSAAYQFPQFGAPLTRRGALASSVLQSDTAAKTVAPDRTYENVLQDIHPLIQLPPKRNKAIPIVTPRSFPPKPAIVSRVLSEKSNIRNRRDSSKVVVPVGEKEHNGAGKKLNFDSGRLHAMGGAKKRSKGHGNGRHVPRRFGGSNENVPGVSRRVERMGNALIVY